MIKKSLIAITVVALLAASVQAGEVKWHLWPGHQPPYVFDPQPIGDPIPVLMDIGYWAEILNQDAEIELIQESIHEYRGCVDLEIETNFAAELGCIVTPTGAILGDYSCTVEPSLILDGLHLVNVCVLLENADLGGMPGGTEGVHVANVQMTIIPSGL